MGERKGTKGLELWCRRMTEGYPGVNVTNMTTSWRDGLAFCAIIHHFRPDLIEFSKLNKDDIYYNNELAFRTAERHLGIPALLEPEDMVEFAVPDRLSILTYLSQFYQAFVVSQGKSPSRIAPKRATTSTDHGIVSPASTSPPTKVAFLGAGNIRREPCAKCGLPVFIAERLNVGKLLYHRTCFRCARCNSQLTLANYYETENNEFCCETCPDEEKPLSGTGLLDDKSVLTRSLSDEEKSAGLKKNDNSDDYSTKFETALEYPTDDTLERNSTLKSSQYSKARSFFIGSQVKDSSSESGDEDKPPDLPSTEPPNKSELFKASENIPLEDSVLFSDSCFPSNRLKATVNTNSSGSLSKQPNAVASIKLEKSQNVVTKDTISAEGDTNASLVRARMRLFEQKVDKSDETNENQQISRKVTEVPAKNSNRRETVHKKSSLSNSEFENSPEHIFKDNISNNDKNKEDANISTVNILDSSEEVNISTINVLDSSEEENKSCIIIEDDVVEIPDSLKDKQDSPVSSLSPYDESKDENVLLKNEINIKEEAIKATTPDKQNIKLPIIESTKLLERSESIIVDETILTLPRNNNLDETPGDLTEPRIETQIKYTSVSFPSPTTNSDQSSSEKKTHTFEIKTEEQPVPRNIEEQYPDALNPFGDDKEEAAESNKVSTVEEKTTKSEKVSLNPFEDDEDEKVAVAPSPKPAVRRKVKPSTLDRDIKGTPECLSKVYIQRISVNPFEEDEDDDEKNKSFAPPQPASRKKVVEAPRISLNPFWSDDEEREDGSGESTPRPVPKPRTSNRTSAASALEAKARDHELSINSSFGSSTSLSSSHSGPAHTLKKRKPAPKRPAMSGTESGPSSLTSSPCHSVTHSPRLTPKLRKAKKAPLPPPSSTPLQHIISSQPDATQENDFEKEKIAKDELNRNRQIQTLQSPTSSENSLSLGAPNKSTYGKWKRRKGQAPSRPIPQKRTIKSLPMVEVRRELELIEIQQLGLEKQGVRLEQMIRDKCEGPDVSPDDSLSPEIEDLVLQLFELVNEKNELFRKQAELMYLRRQHRLEVEHADVEYQIRCLMLQPEANKTDSDKAREEELINRLVEIVERRNEIIECLEMDRVREAEEDDSINNQLNLYTQKKEDKSSDRDAKKDKKKHKKEKKFKLKVSKVDADKDIDDSESSSTLSINKIKEKKKKKFNIF